MPRPPSHVTLVSDPDTEHPTGGQPAAQRVLDELRGLIVKGDLAPGSRIVERALCAKMNVSRTPLREALKLLELDGLIELSQNRGARVRPFTTQEAVSLFEVLAGLESLAAELATARITPEGMRNLLALHRRMADHYARGEKDPYFALNSQIHEAVIVATENPVLLATHRQLMLRAKRGRYMAIVDPRRWQQAMEEHEELMDAIMRRNAADAGRIWRTHLTHTGQTVAAVLKRTERDKDAS
ncbi:GntR family transcriptional regulator [Acuticoccus kandeliae]|uniref:GntR family transcriptional regulator n=1 Tax=Acuticoccus kandeliae TaxID=2073160 RepID=UPI000D3E2727|nr:GntR family transcriptional regulator [Acuticoccus kandeliae]